MRITIPISTGSSPVHLSPANGSPRLSFSDHDALTGILFPGHRRRGSAPHSLHFEARSRRRAAPPGAAIRRAMSEADVIRPTSSPSRLGSGGRNSFPGRIAEAEEEHGPVIVKRSLSDCESEANILVVGEPAVEESEVSGGGMGRGRRRTGGGGGVNGGGTGGGDGRGIGEYYEEMLRANPGNPLLLRNYGKFLHEVSGDVKRAEECYERAIVASPNDGEVMALYARLIWETRRDGVRAESYFDRAVQASPEDCYVLGAYAKFLWDAEDDEEDNEAQEKNTALASALVEAF